jgi:hypothetical protein
MKGRRKEEKITLRRSEGYYNKMRVLSPSLLEEIMLGNN